MAVWPFMVGQGNALVGGPDAVLVVVDTALPKQGKRSVGVARQYCGCLGKRANCQVLVPLTLASNEVPVPVSLRLFLPETWVADADRCAAAGIPAEHRQALAKTEIALMEIDRSLPPALALAVWWPMPATAAARPSAKA